MTPEQEQIDPATLEADQSRMSDLLTKVSADGHEVLDEPPAPAQEQDLEPSPEGEVVGTQPEPEPPTPPAQEETPAGEGESQQPPVGEDAPQDDYEREIEEKYQPPKGASQRTTEVLKILKRINREEHRKAKTLEKEKQELESRKFLDEQTEKELKDLRELRDRDYIERSPEFNEQFVQKIQQHEGRAMSILKHHELPDETIKFIGENGGLIRFQNSERRMPAGTRGLATDAYPDGAPFNGTQSEWYKEVMEPMFDSLPPAAKTRLKYELDEALKTAIQRDDALQEARGNPQKFIQEREQQQQELTKEFAKRADAQLQKEADLYGEIAKPKEVPEKATAEQKAEILSHNAKIDEAKNQIVQFMNDLAPGRLTPEHAVKLTTALAYRNFAQEHVKEVESKLAEKTKALNELQAKWDAAKNKAQTSRQQSSVAQVKDREPQKAYDAAESIKNLMEQVPA